MYVYNFICMHVMYEKKNVPVYTYACVYEFM